MSKRGRAGVREEASAVPTSDVVVTQSVGELGGRPWENERAQFTRPPTDVPVHPTQVYDAIGIGVSSACRPSTVLRFFPRNLLGRTQKICDGVVIKVALIEGRWISAIKELTGVSDFEVDTRPPTLGTISRACRHWRWDPTSEASAASFLFCDVRFHADGCGKGRRHQTCLLALFEHTQRPLAIGARSHCEPGTQHDLRKSRRCLLSIHGP